MSRTGHRTYRRNRARALTGATTCHICGQPEGARDELVTAAQACLEDNPPDPNAIELATRVLAYLEGIDTETLAGIRRGLADLEAGRYTTVPPGNLERVLKGTASPSVRARDAIARALARRQKPD